MWHMMDVSLCFKDIKFSGSALKIESKMYLRERRSYFFETELMISGIIFHYNRR